MFDTSHMHTYLYCLLQVSVHFLEKKKAAIENLDKKDAFTKSSTIFWFNSLDNVPIIWSTQPSHLGCYWKKIASCFPYAYNCLTITFSFKRRLCSKSWCFAKAHLFTFVYPVRLSLSDAFLSCPLFLSYSILSRSFRKFFPCHPQIQNSAQYIFEISSNCTRFTPFLAQILPHPKLQAFVQIHRAENE